MWYRHRINARNSPSLPDNAYQIILYRIVGFFEVRKFREFLGYRCCSFVNLTPRKNEPPVALLSFGRPIRENKMAENQPFAEFKYLEKTNYTVVLARAQARAACCVIFTRAYIIRNEVKQCHAHCSID